MEIVEDKIETGLQILDQREVGLIELAEKYKGLTIDGIEDKEGYKKVREARIELKNARVAVENDAKALRENAVKFQKTVIAREKELVLITLRTEKSLQEEEEKYKKALEEIRIKEERERQERIQARINALAKFGRAIDLYDATTMPDDKFNELLTQAEIDFNAEQEKIAQQKAEAERLRNEEAERLRIEREELAKQREEMERIDREFRAIQLQVKQEQEAREQELKRQEAERITEIRAAKEALEEAERKRIAQRVEEDRQRQEEIRLENERIAAERKKLEDEKRQHEEQIRLEQAKKEAAERARIEEQERIKREAEEKIERERLEKIEAERQEALKPDKEKLYEYARALMAIPVPELSHKDALKIVGEISERVVQTSEFIHDKAKAL